MDKRKTSYNIKKKKKKTWGGGGGVIVHIENQKEAIITISTMFSHRKIVIYS